MVYKEKIFLGGGGGGETKSNQNRRWVTGIIYFPRGQFTMSKFTQELKKSFTNTE